MNYLGLARNADGSPKYEASYEINASLQIKLSGISAARQSPKSCPDTSRHSPICQNLYVARYGRSKPRLLT